MTQDGSGSVHVTIQHVQFFVGHVEKNFQQVQFFIEKKFDIPFKFVIGHEVFGPAGAVRPTQRVCWTRQGPVIIAG